MSHTTDPKGIQATTVERINPAQTFLRQLPRSQAGMTYALFLDRSYGYTLADICPSCHQVRELGGSLPDVFIFKVGDWRDRSILYTSQTSTL